MTPPPGRAAVLLICVALAGCLGGADPAPVGQLDAPGVDHAAQAVDGVAVGHRLIAAGEYELAIRAFNRAGRQGCCADSGQQKT